MEIELAMTHANIRYHMTIFAQHTLFDKWINRKVVGVGIDFADKLGFCLVVVNRELKDRDLSIYVGDNGVVFGVVVGFVNHFLSGAFECLNVRTNTHSNIGFLFVQSNYFKKIFQFFKVLP
jgi:hypothetical protein